MPIDIGGKIRSARKAAKLTQKELAEKIDVTNTSISNWEVGLSRPTIEQLGSIALALNTTVYEMIGSEWSGIDTTELNTTTKELISRDWQHSEKEKEMDNHDILEIKRITYGQRKTSVHVYIDGDLYKKIAKISEESGQTIRVVTDRMLEFAIARTKVCYDKTEEEDGG